MGNTALSLEFNRIGGESFMKLAFIYWKDFFVNWNHLFIKQLVRPLSGSSRSTNLQECYKILSRFSVTIQFVIFNIRSKYSKIIILLPLTAGEGKYCNRVKISKLNFLPETRFMIHIKSRSKLNSIYFLLFGYHKRTWAHSALYSACFCHCHLHRK